MITVHDLFPNVEVRADPGSPPLSADLEKAVATAWEAERARRPDLTDGTLFSIERFSADRIAGRFVPYRHRIAQRARPELAAALAVRPLAVSGLLLCADGVVFGRRADRLTDAPGKWELVPSGGVEASAADTAGRVDLRRQILAELAEEIGLDAGDVSGLELFCAVEDDDSGIVDIGIALASSLSAETVRRRHAERGSGEYVEIAIIAVSQVPGFVAAREGELPAVSRVLLERRGLLADSVNSGISSIPRNGPGRR